ncbi:hypothetical protein DI396_07915 [Litorivita pollutaquae]|uniref:Uncharacterized protein n=1 Tax=Litorivita pollutaquae TaxID=2200892 RepID=A0A2V4NNN2_9RHOB|nr:hypothetical protein [Litorivita pollutaquae]PYC47997.1 hypothetical protein DI396_07915 [Litorivita pollutaquae]
MRLNDSIDPSVADSVTITVTAPTDTEAPVIGAIADIAVNTDAGGNTASVVLTAPITDNSGETIAPVFSILGSTITSPMIFRSAPRLLRWMRKTARATKQPSEALS